MITPKQYQIYTFIQNYFAKNNCAPTLREIGASVNISSRGVVYRHVKALAHHGFLCMVERNKRNIQLTKKQPHSHITTYAE